jgi:hypothetical protein
MQNRKFLHIEVVAQLQERPGASHPKRPAITLSRRPARRRRADAPAPEPIELWERETVLKFFGGDKPLHVSTLYRGVHSGRYPPPVYVSDNIVRWVGHECHAARQRMLSARAGPKQPSRRGRPRRQRIT